MEELISIAGKFTYFICFAIDKTVAIHDVTVTSKELTNELLHKKVQSPIKVYYPSLPYTEIPPKINIHNMLFTFPEIKNGAKGIIINWIKLYDGIEPSLRLYFSVKSGAQKYLNNKFLTLAQSLESYHRLKYDDVKMAEYKFENLINNLIQSCPDENKEWIAEKLKYTNEFNLRYRLKKY